MTHSWLFPSQLCRLQTDVNVQLYCAVILLSFQGMIGPPGRPGPDGPQGEKVTKQFLIRVTVLLRFI